MTSSTLGGLPPWNSFGPIRTRFVALVFSTIVWITGGERASAEGQAFDSIDRDAFLRAIAEVETGGNSRAVGRAGERGMYQFRRQTWHSYTRRSFHEAHNPVTARSVAERHLDWLIDGFARNDRTPTPYLVAAAWNSGLSRTLSGGMSRSTREYARRVSNIVAAHTAPKQVPPSTPRLFVASAD